MTRSPNVKPCYEVAGAGAGKTHGMVEAVAASLDSLSPCRSLAVVAFTHAATRVIRERLAKRVAIPPNVFVGTTHAFVARFILRPFGRLLGDIPEGVIYSEVAAKPGMKPAGLAAYRKAVLKKGVMDYSEMLSKSATLVENSLVRSRVGGRLQYLFVDEFQDISPALLRTLEALRKEKKTAIRVVGDPEQYINGFTYKDAGTKRPDADALPFAKFAKKATAEERRENYRANGELVRFSNQFRSDFHQQSMAGDRGGDAVFFIRSTDLKEVVKAFRSLTDGVPSAEGGARKRLYLAQKNKFFDSVRSEYGIVHVGKEARRGKSLHADARELLSVAVGKQERDLVWTLGNGLVGWRRAACRLLFRLGEGEMGFDEFKRFADDELGMKVSESREKHLLSMVADLQGALSGGTRESGAVELSASLNKAKGLEADAVLLVAETQAQLLKFFETDAEARRADKSDACRLGYVGATRARERLVLACVHAIDGKAEAFLGGLGVKLQDACDR